MPSTVSAFLSRDPRFGKPSLNRSITIYLALAVTIVVVLPSGSAEQIHAAKDIVLKVSRLYARAKRYQFEMETTSRVSGGHQPQTEVFHVSIAVEKPDRARIHVRTDSTELLTVLDGKFTWASMPQLKQYTKTKGAPVHSDRGNPDSQTVLGSPSQHIAHVDELFAPYQQLAAIADQVRIVREEPISLSTKQVNCYVIELKTDGADGSPQISQTRTWWIDKARYVVLREDTRNIVILPARKYERWTSTVYSFVSIDRPVARDLFLWL